MNSEKQIKKALLAELKRHRQFSADHAKRKEIFAGIRAIVRKIMEDIGISRLMRCFDRSVVDTSHLITFHIEALLALEEGRLRISGWVTSPAGLTCKKVSALISGHRFISKPHRLPFESGTPSQVLPARFDFFLRPKRGISYLTLFFHTSGDLAIPFFKCLLRRPLFGDSPTLIETPSSFSNLTGINSETPLSTLGRSPELDIYYGESALARSVSASTSLSIPCDCPFRQAGLTVIILNKNKPEFILPLVDQLSQEASIFQSKGLTFEVFIGDTGSTSQQVLDLLAKPPWFCKVFKNLEYHFSSCNNTLARKAITQTLLFLNNDIVLPRNSGALFELYNKYQATPEAGALGVLMFYPGGLLIQHAGIGFLTETRKRGLPFHLDQKRQANLQTSMHDRKVHAVTGAALMTDAALFFECGGFNTAYMSECQDVALCLEFLKLGHINKCVNVGEVIHHENGTRPKGEENLCDRRRFLRLFGAFIDQLLDDEADNQPTSNSKYSNA